MKKILGLDLGTTSIGWALVNEAQEDNETSKIVKLGVRVNPLTTDEKKKFEEGKPITTNADRTLKRSARRNLQRYKLRRQLLIDTLIRYNIITKDSVLTQVGKNSTYETLEFRDKATREKISLENFSRVLLMINKKRGYKSSRKVNNNDDGFAVDGMGIAKYLYDNKLTPGQYVLKQLQNNKKHIPSFYQSDLILEFNKIWGFQKQYYPDILDDNLYEALKNQGKLNSIKCFKTAKGIYTAENKGKRDVVKLQHYTWRSKAVEHKLDIEQVAYVLVEINNNINKSSGYLGQISDRSKNLHFNNITVGTYLYQSIQNNKHTSLKNKVFYRQDYLDEFEKIWETQAKYHPLLTPKLKAEVRDIVIFYQRKLKSQKSLLSFCQLEQWQQTYYTANGKLSKRTIGSKVVSRSSPLFQEFKIWQNLNILQFEQKDRNNKDVFVLDDEQRSLIFEALNVRGKLKEKDILSLLKLNTKLWKTNFSEGLEGNNTNKALYNIYQSIAEQEGYGLDWANKTAKEIKTELIAVFNDAGIDSKILDFNVNLNSNDFYLQPSYQLWHLLYATEDDDNITQEDRIKYGNSNVILKKNLEKKFGFKPEHTKLLANIALEQDYANLSTKALKKIIPHLQVGNNYSTACALVGYNHSNSLNKEDNNNRVLKDKLDILPKNSLRNPIVEKIINQTINLVNQVIDTYGKPDEVRVELARDLKKSAKERETTTKHINSATKINDDIKKVIKTEFGFTATKNDVVKYKLYQELKTNGYKTIFSNKYIPKERIFSKDIDIEHIIPKAILYDDSFSNKTLAYRQVNLKKADRTAFDFISQDYHSKLDSYTATVNALFDKKAISKSKQKKLLTPSSKLPTNFIERDLRNSQYIAKKTVAILQEAFTNVNTTTGQITSKLRDDWDLVNVMKELNLPKYKTLNLTEIEERKGGKRVEIITNWTKRNDHRHHAMDALTVAFTTVSHIQYINNLNAARNETNKVLYGLKQKLTKTYTEHNGNKKRKFIPPVISFREEAKKHLNSVLVSFKTKNKVLTNNINKTKTNVGYNSTLQQTPRGQLHKETIYGKSKRELSKPTTLNKKFTPQLAALIVNSEIKALILKHLKTYNNNAALAFSSKNLKNNPIMYKNEPLKSVFCFEEIYTIRKDIDPTLKIDKVLDGKTKLILQKRLKTYGNAKLAFTDLDNNPIWLNKEKGIKIKRVTITGPKNVEALHYKKDHFGKPILDVNGQKQPVDFVSTGNNHHIAIYKDNQGKLQEKPVSFFEAVARANAKLPVIDKAFNAHIGWEFLYTLKQNEMFVFPKDDFNPNTIDLKDPKHAKLILEHLFRVQKTTTKDYFFRHHLETNVIESKATLHVSWKRVGLSGLKGIIKVRLNHLGQIVEVGEY